MSSMESKTPSPILRFPETGNSMTRSREDSFVKFVAPWQAFAKTVSVSKLRAGKWKGSEAEKLCAFILRHMGGKVYRVKKQAAARFMKKQENDIFGCYDVIRRADTKTQYVQVSTIQQRTKKIADVISVMGGMLTQDSGDGFAVDAVWSFFSYEGLPHIVADFLYENDIVSHVFRVTKEALSSYRGAYRTAKQVRFV